MPDRSHAEQSDHQRQCDAFDLVERALCLIESAGHGSAGYAVLLQRAIDEAAEAGIASTLYRGRAHP